MFRWGVWAAATVGVLAIAGPTQAAVIYDGAVIEGNSITGVSTQDPENLVYDEQLGYDENFDPVLRDLSIINTHDLLQLTVDDTLLGEVSGQFSAALDFVDSAHGSFVVDEDFQTTNYAAGVLNQASVGLFGFLYNFIVDENSTLNLSFSGGQGILTIYNSGTIYEAPLSGDGVLTLDLAPGFGGIQLRKNGGPGFIRNAEIGSVSRHLTTTVDFAITPAAVPEPATWALMIFGLGFAGGALRRAGSVVRARIS